MSEDASADKNKNNHHNKKQLETLKLIASNVSVTL